MAPKRVVKTDKPPPTEDLGPTSPVSPTNRTKASAYYVPPTAGASAAYNAALASGVPPERVVYNPSGNDATPDIVLRFDEAAHEKRAESYTGDELNEIHTFYRDQISKLFEGQMDALANQHKETQAHASTRDAFAIVYASLDAELAAKKALEDEKARLQAEAAQLGSRQPAAVEGDAPALPTNDQKAFLVLLKSWEQQVETIKERNETIENLEKRLDESLLLKRSSEDNNDMKELRALLKVEKDTVATRDATIASLQSDLLDNQDLLKSNQNSFAEIFRAKDARHELQVQLDKEKEAVAARDTTIKELQAQLDEVEDAELRKGEDIDDLGSWVDQLLKEQRSSGGTGTKTDIQTLLTQHALFLSNIQREFIPKINKTRAISHIINAQICFSQNNMTDGLDFLFQAEQENNKSKPDRRIQGRILYWRGRVTLHNGDGDSAVALLQRAYDIERRGSSMGSLYDMRGMGVDFEEEDEDKTEKPNYLIRGKKLDVKTWLKKAKDSRDTTD